MSSKLIITFAYVSVLKTQHLLIVFHLITNFSIVSIGVLPLTRSNVCSVKTAACETVLMFGSLTSWKTPDGLNHVTMKFRTL